MTLHMRDMHKKYILMEQCLIHINSKDWYEQPQSEQAWYDSEESFCLPRPYHYTLRKMSQQGYSIYSYRKRNRISTLEPPCFSEPCAAGQLMVTSLQILENPLGNFYPLVNLSEADVCLLASVKVPGFYSIRLDLNSSLQLPDRSAFRS